MKKRLMTTSELAQQLAVTPDTVLKWAKAGKIPAVRTVGGHFRISDKVLHDLLNAGKDKVWSALPFCWDFHIQAGNLKTTCRKCVVFRSKTLRCWELELIPTDIGHLRRYCKTTCDECSYKKYVFSQNRSRPIS